MDDDTAVRRGLAVLGTGLFGMGLAVGGYGALVTLLIERGVSPADAGLGMSLFLLGQLLIVAPADWLTRRRSVRSVAAAGFLLGGLGAALAGSPSLGGALASRLLLGFGQGAAFVGGMKFVGQLTAGARTAAAQGFLGALFTLGLAVGIAGAPTTLDAVGPAVPSLAVAGVVLAGAAGTAGLDAFRDDAPAVARAYVAPLASRSGLALGLANMGTFGFLIVATTWYADALANVGGVSITHALAGFAGATVAGRWAGGRLSSVLDRPAIVGYSLLALAGALALLATAVGSASGPLVLAAMVVTGLGFGVPFGPLFSLAFSTLADDPGVTLVVMLAVGNAGALAYPWFVGHLVATSDSFAPGFGAMALTVVGIWVVWRLGVPRGGPTPARAD